jgi:hypothetical protein
MWAILRQAGSALSAMEIVQGLVGKPEVFRFQASRQKLLFAKQVLYASEVED